MTTRTTATPTRSGLAARLASAAVLLPWVVLAVWTGRLPLALVAAVVAGRACFELVRLLRGQCAGVDWGAVLVSTLLPLVPQLAPAEPWAAALGLLVAANVAAWSWLTLRGDVEQGPPRAAALAFGALVCGVGLLCVVRLRALPAGREWLFGLLTAAWLNDACAFFGGSALGRHRLAPRVSPGKTWEGLALGALGAFAGLGALVASGLSSRSLLDAAALAGLVSVLGPLGDLSKSLLKRHRGVKDAGQLIPGHGGLLDRIDSLLFSAPAVLLYAALAR